MSNIASINSASSSGTTSSVVNKGGNVSGFSDNGALSAIDTYGNQFDAPDYTIKDILSAIPTHCYERRVVESMSYVLRDIALMLAVGYVGNTYIALIPSAVGRFVAWAVYVNVQGLVATGLWVLAHECGHQAFSDYNWVNDTVGWVLHSYLMVPYFSWKYSHSKHHKATGHLTRDMVFVPKTKQEFLKAKHAHSIEEVAGDAPLYTLYLLVVQQVFGWWVYLFTNVTGQGLETVSAWNKNHFNPASVLFEKREYWYIVLSDIGILAQLVVLYNWYQAFGGFNVLVNWFLPYVLVNHWLVFITFLQHSDPKMPHYQAEAWTFARGAAATIDREFGFVGQHILHDIIETHVLHHYVSRIPFYNAREASEAIKKVMGKHYMHSDENMFQSLWKSGRWCQYVDGDNGVMMYRNVNGLGVKPT